MLQYKIPQNVGIEDKIVGPFSLRQLIIVAIGGGISYVAFAISSKFYELNILEYVLIVLPALFSLALAMLKIHNVSFGKYLLLLAEFAIKPKKRVWDHRGISALVAPDLTDKTAAKKQEVTKGTERKDVNLRDLSSMLDSGGFEHVQQVKHEDIDEVTDDDLITEAYFGHKQKSKSDNMYWRTREVQKKKLDLLAKMEAAKKPEPAKAPIQTAEASPEKPQEKKESVVQHLANVIKEARKNNQTKKTEEVVQPAPQEQATPVAQKPTTPVAKATPTEAPAEAPTEAPKKKRRRRKRKPKQVAAPVRPDTPVNTITAPETPKKKEVPPQKETPKETKKEIKTEGEASFDDLSKGGEIEINLD